MKKRKKQQGKRRGEFLKQTPCDIEAEKTLLGAMLFNKEIVLDISEILTPDDFYHDINGFIFKAIIDLEARDITPDLITLTNVIPRYSKSIPITYIAQLVDGANTAANATYYADLIKEKSILRQLINKQTNIINKIHDNNFETAQELLSEAEQSILAINSREQTNIAHVKTMLLSYMTGLENMKPGISGVKTPFSRFDYATSGFQKKDLILIAARPGMGKAQPLYSMIKTFNGWKTMGELKLGDRLASIDGKESFVDGIYPQGEKEIYRVTFSDGRSTCCCGDHLWNVSSCKWKHEERILTTKEILKKLEIERYQKRMTIPLVNGEFGNKTDLPINPWLLGILIGDGNLTNSSPMSSAGDIEIVYDVQNILDDGLSVVYSGKYDYRIISKETTINPLMKSLRELNLHCCLSYEKFIPQQYLESDKESRMELLRGLLDTDGWVEKSGSVRYSTSSKRLSIDVQYLVRSLGGVCSISEKTPFYIYNNERKQGRLHYICNIRMSNPEEIFKLKRKKARCTIKRNPVLTISSVELLGIEQAQCISVSHPSNLYITDNYIVTHNTSFATEMAAYSVLNGLTVAFFSIEMPREQILNRIYAQQVRIPLKKFRMGGFESEEWDRINSFSARLNKSNLIIEDKPITTLEMRSKCRRIKKQYGLDLVIIDYLQKISGHKKTENRNHELGVISGSLKDMAKEFDVPIVSLAQLNRSVEQRADKHPMMSDLRDSGNLEQDADMICFLYRDDYYNPESEKKGVTELVISKQRNGETGSVEMNWDGVYTKLSDPYVSTEELFSR